MDKKNVLLVFGGNSFEHDISIITALTLYNKAKVCSYNLLPIYLSKSNEWFFYSKDNFNINLFKDFETNYKTNGFVKAYFNDKSCLCYKKSLIEKKIQVYSVINCCHGGIGENGTITAYFNMLNIPISSGSVLSQAIGMDKVISKFVFNELNIPTIKFFKFTKHEFINKFDDILKKIKRLEYPLILKPSTLGSSIGIKIAKNQEEFIESAKVALEFDNTILVEKAILDNLREYNVACLYNNGNIVVSEVDKPKRTDEILSFKDKYIGDGNISSKRTNKTHSQKSGAYLDNKLEASDLTQSQNIKLKEFAEKVYRELGLFGPVRIDFIMDKKNKIYINEINTVPGSLAYYFFIPNEFKSMNDYLCKLVENSIIYNKTQNNIKKEFITKLI